MTIEAEPDNAQVARANLDRAGVGEKVEIKLGRAADVLPTLEGSEPFDLVFIDADKESNTIYIDWAARLGRSGTVVVVDNVGRGGEVANPATMDAQVIGTQRGLELLGRDPRFDATALQTLDLKGYDGIAIAARRLRSASRGLPVAAASGSLDSGADRRRSASPPAHEQGAFPWH